MFGPEAHSVLASLTLVVLNAGGESLSVPAVYFFHLAYHLPFVGSFIGSVN